MNAWERRKGESKEAYAAFEAYYTLEFDERSIDAAYQKRNKNGKTNGTWRTWSTRHDWVDRSAAYDAHMAAIRQQEREKRERKWAARREKLREEQLDRELRHADALETKALKLLALNERRVAAKDDQGRPIEFAPAHASEFGKAADMLKTAREFMRGVLEMPIGVTRQEVTGKDGGAVIVRREYTDEELEQIVGSGGGAGAFGAAKGAAGDS